MFFCIIPALRQAQRRCKRLWFQLTFLLKPPLQLGSDLHHHSVQPLDLAFFIHRLETFIIDRILQFLEEGVEHLLRFHDLQQAAGRIDHAEGAVIGGFLVIGFFDIIVQSYLPLPKEWYGQAIPNIKEIVFGALLIIVLLFRPLGILGDMRRDKLMRRVHGG